MSATIPQISREYLYVEGVRAFRDGEEANPTALTVQVAIVAQGAYPEEADWKAASWYDSTTVRILVGPSGAVTPAAGRYTAWLRITGATERPARAVGAVLIKP